MATGTWPEVIDLFRKISSKGHDLTHLFKSDMTSRRTCAISKNVQSILRTMHIGHFVLSLKVFQFPAFKVKASAVKYPICTKQGGAGKCNGKVKIDKAKCPTCTMERLPFEIFLTSSIFGLIYSYLWLERRAFLSDVL